MYKQSILLDKTTKEIRVRVYTSKESNKKYNDYFPSPEVYALQVIVKSSSLVYYITKYQQLRDLIDIKNVSCQII